MVDTSADSCRGWQSWQRQHDANNAPGLVLRRCLTTASLCSSLKCSSTLQARACTAELTARWGLKMPSPAGLGMPGTPAAAVCRPADTTAPLPAAARTELGLAAGVACLYVTTHALPLISRLQDERAHFCGWPQHLRGTKVQTGCAPVPHARQSPALEPVFDSSCTENL